MLEELSRLIELQELDQKIRALSQAQEELPAGLREREAELLEIQTALEAEKLQLEEIKQQHRHQEAEMEMLDESITRSRARLMGIKENLEYKAMLREISFREDRKDQKETEILELLEEIEVHDAALAQRKQTMQVKQREFKRLQAEVKKKLAELSQQVQELNEKRPQLIQSLPPALLKRYEFIRDRLNGTAVAEVRQGVCQSCHMNIPPQQFIELQKQQEILTCPHCQRIIYWLGEPETEENASKTAAR